jgi:signal transduction histidine kinase
VILVSAVRTGSDEQADGLAAGADGYIARPISNRELLARVDAMLRIKRAEDELTESRRQLRELASHLEAAREEERATLARELHDIVGQAFTALMLDIQWIESRLPAEDIKARERVRQMNAVLGRLFEESKRMSMNLRPTFLDDLGLGAALEWHAQDYQSRYGISCTVRAEELELSPECATLLFRVCQEALTHIALHSGAGRVDVALSAQGSNCVLAISADGEGMPPARASNADAIALVRLRERLQPFGGFMTVTQSPDQRTMLSFTIPLEPCGLRG